MILKGEQYTVETVEQFVRRTSFDAYDVLETLVETDRLTIDDPVADVNELREDEQNWDPADSVRDLYEEDVWEYITGYSATYEAITATLEEDSRVWIHLYDGTIHDIVEVYEGNFVDYEVVR